jgi:hypothetical protein
MLAGLKIKLWPTLFLLLMFAFIPVIGTSPLGGAIIG